MRRELIKNKIAKFKTSAFDVLFRCFGLCVYTSINN
jgi:hypothetical protein